VSAVRVKGRACCSRGYSIRERRDSIFWDSRIGAQDLTGIAGMKMAGLSVNCERGTWRHGVEERMLGAGLLAAGVENNLWLFPTNVLALTVDCHISRPRSQPDLARNPGPPEPQVIRIGDIFNYPNGHGRGNRADGKPEKAIYDFTPYFM